MGLSTGPNAEAAFIGALLNRPDGIADVIGLVAPTDFARPSLGESWAALRALWETGQGIDVVTVASELVRRGIKDVKEVIGLQASAPSSDAQRYARLIVREATTRRIVAAAADVLQQAQEGGDPAELLDYAHNVFGGIDLPIAKVPADLTTISDFLAQPEDRWPAWVVPGLLRERWRALIVASEGLAKSVLLRQIAVSSAAGVHPFSRQPIPAIRTLIVDLENPPDAIAATCNVLRDGLRTPWEEGKAWLWHRPGGLNLRGRLDRAAFEAVIVHCQPQLICMGPLYKLYRVSAKENDELAAGEAQQALDDIRMRYNIAFLLEHHAPKRQGQNVRDLVPYGSSLWLRWPELGLNLQRDEKVKGRLKIQRFRGDRCPAQWPDFLDRAQNWPYEGVWADGMPT